MAILIQDSSFNVIFSDPNAPSGGLLVGGVASTRATYNHTTTGSLLVSGGVSARATYSHVAIGSLLVSGLADVSVGYYFAAENGGIEFSGRATVTRVNNVIGYGRLRLRGEADVDFIRSFEGDVLASFTGRAGGINDVFVIPHYQGSGHKRLKGTAEVTFIPAVEGNVWARIGGIAGVVLIPNVEGNVQARIGGFAQTSFLGAYEASGRLRVRGSALSDLQPDFDHEPSGGFAITSSPTEPISSFYEYEAGGVLSLSGYATRIRTVLRGVVFTGGVGFTGTYDTIVLGFAPQALGGLSLRGQAELSSSSYEYFPEAGVIGFTGLAGTTQNYRIEASGALLIRSGNAEILSEASVNGSVLFGFSGTANVSIQDKFLKKFAWRIREEVSFDKTFAWGVGERPFSFFRVSGKCKPAQCPPIQVNGCQPDSKFTFVVNIFARNLAEVCRKLRERNMIFPIATIEKFSTPASRIDYTDDTDTTCNKLFDVTPPITFLPCQDLLVDFNANVDIGVDMKAIRVVAQYNASGRLGLSGSLYPFDHLIYDPIGVMRLSGAATCVQENYNYEAFGAIGFDGTVEDITIPVWTYDGRGEIAATVDAEPVRIVYPDWFMQAGGSLGFVGNWASVPRMIWNMSGEISKGNSTALGEEDFLPYITGMTGGIGLSGVTDGSRGEYVYEGSGGVGFTGLTHFLTPHITIEPSGSLRMSNGIGSVPTTSSNIGIEYVFAGSASVVFTPEYASPLRFSLSGEAAVNCSVIEPNGQLRIRGTALVNCSDLGEIAMPFAADFFVRNETVLFAYDAAPAAVRPARRITTRCCTQSLPLRLWVQHPLAGANHFSQFLRRNNLLIDNPVQVYYNQSEKAWYNTIHFEGFAPDFPTIESWSITFGWSCSDHILPGVALSDADLYYRFSIMATLRSINNPTIPHRVSKFLVGFDPSRACFNNKTFSFPFIFDTTAKTTNPTAVQTLAYVDGIGLFKSQEFLKSPEIRFKVSEIVDDIPQAVVDIGPALTGSQRLGSSFNGSILSSLPG